MHYPEILNVQNTYVPTMLGLCQLPSALHHVQQQGCCSARGSQLSRGLIFALKLFLEVEHLQFAANPEFSSIFCDHLAHKSFLSTIWYSSSILAAAPSGSGRWDVIPSLLRVLWIMGRSICIKRFAALNPQSGKHSNGVQRCPCLQYAFISWLVFFKYHYMYIASIYCTV